MAILHGRSRGLMIAAGSLSGLMLLGFASAGWNQLPIETDFTEFLGVLGSLAILALFLERSLAVVNDILFDRQKTEELLDALYGDLNDQLILANKADAEEIRTTATNGAERIAFEIANQEEIAAELDTSRQRLRLALGFIVAILISGVGVRSLDALVTEPPPLERTNDENSNDGSGPGAPPTLTPTPNSTLTSAPDQVTTENATKAPQTVDQADAVPAATELGGDDEESEEPSRGFRHWLFDLLDILLTAGLLAGGSNGIAQLIGAIGGKGGSRRRSSGAALIRAERWAEQSETIPMFSRDAGDPRKPAAST